jgi:hypothetical protein
MYAGDGKPSVKLISIPKKEKQTMTEIIIGSIVGGTVGFCWKQTLEMVFDFYREKHYGRSPHFTSAYDSRRRV